MGTIDKGVDFIDRQEGHSSFIFGLKVSNRYRNELKLAL